MPSQKSTTATTAPAVNAFEVSHSTKDRWHTVTDSRTGRVVKTFLWEDNAKFGPASVRARECADALWFAELQQQPEVAPEPTPEAPAALPSYTMLPDTVSSAAEMLEAARAHQHSVNTALQFLLTFQEHPQLWARVWTDLSESQQDDVLAGAHLAGATPYQLSAMAGAKLFHDSAPGQVEMAKAA